MSRFHEETLLREATEADRDRLGAMLRSYQMEIAEFSEGVARDRTLEPQWFEHPGLHPFVIDQDSIPVGMALVMGREYAAAMGEATDYLFNDLWVEPGVRGAGIAERAVREVLERFPGSWSVTVLARNDRAQGFWQRALADFLPAGGPALNEDGNTVHRFTA